jgi:hypothetical protein
LSFKRYDNRLNIYYTTGTVGTALLHPARDVATQLFRRNVTLAELVAIFMQPRAHTGKGYYRVPTGESLESALKAKRAALLAEVEEIDAMLAEVARGNASQRAAEAKKQLKLEQERVKREEERRREELRKRQERERQEEEARRERERQEEEARRERERQEEEARIERERQERIERERQAEEAKLNRRGRKYHFTLASNVADYLNNYDVDVGLKKSIALGLECVVTLTDSGEGMWIGPPKVVVNNLTSRQKSLPKPVFCALGTGHNIRDYDDYDDYDGYSDDYASGNYQYGQNYYFLQFADGKFKFHGPSGLLDELDENAWRMVSCLSFGYNDSWFVLYEDGVYNWNGIPETLSKKINGRWNDHRQRQKFGRIEWVALSPDSPSV